MQTAKSQELLDFKVMFGEDYLAIEREALEQVLGVIAGQGYELVIDGSFPFLVLCDDGVLMTLACRDPEITPPRAPRGVTCMISPSNMDESLRVYWVNHPKQGPMEYLAAMLVKDSATPLV